MRAMTLLYITRYLLTAAYHGFPLSLKISERVKQFFKEISVLCEMAAVVAHKKRNKQLGRDF